MEDTYYDYEPLDRDNQRGRYCQAPRHGTTNVQAFYIEKYAAAELGVEPTESYSCEDCHDSMLQTFMDEQLPKATPEELKDAGLSEDYYDNSV